MMTPNESRILERLEVRLKLSETLCLSDARRLRGAIASSLMRTEFHQHRANGLVYDSPVIRYDTSTGDGFLIGLKHGAFLLRGLPRFEILRLGRREVSVVDQLTHASRCEVGPTEQMHNYRFCSPYLPLNQDNFKVWSKSDQSERRRTLERMLVGNVLSFSKGIGLTVQTRLRVHVDLELEGWRDIKPGVRLLAFKGTVQMNFLFPELWGLGKSTSRGFGTLTREDA